MYTDRLIAHQKISRVWCREMRQSAARQVGAARLPPRLLKGRSRGPVFVTDRRPGPGKVVSPRDVCPDTGLARLSYGQARGLLDEHTALRGLGPGWDLHEYRRSALTHLGEQGASLLMLTAKFRHKKPGERMRPRGTSVQRLILQPHVA